MLTLAYNRAVIVITATCLLCTGNRMIILLDSICNTSLGCTKILWFLSVACFSQGLSLCRLIKSLLVCLACTQMKKQSELNLHSYTQYLHCSHHCQPHQHSLFSSHSGTCSLLFKPIYLLRQWVNPPPPPLPPPLWGPPGHGTPQTRVYDITGNRHEWGCVHGWVEGCASRADQRRLDTLHHLPLHWITLSTWFNITFAQKCWLSAYFNDVWPTSSGVRNSDVAVDRVESPASLWAGGGGNTEV